VVLSGLLAAALAVAHLAVGRMALGDREEVLLHLLLSGTAAAVAAALAARRVRRTEADLAALAFSDVLTGLANRALFTDRLELALRRTARSGGEVAVVFLDLDGFKAVNDSLGHASGDRLIREVGRLLESAVRTEDTLARLGGDEFAILVERSPGREEATRIAERVLAALADPVDLGGQRVTVSASIGIATGDVAATASSLLRDADNAMYWAKGAGRGRFVVFNPQMRSAAAERRQLEADLWAALAGTSSGWSTSPSSTWAPSGSPASRRCCAGTTRSSASCCPSGSCRSRGDRAGPRHRPVGHAPRRARPRPPGAATTRRRPACRWRSTSHRPSSGHRGCSRTSGRRWPPAGCRPRRWSWS
jgi:diguanylate cyclase (GGDEF)-like protein